MNFKFTKKKTIISIILGIAAMSIVAIIIVGSNCIGACPSFSTQIKDLAMLPLTPIFWFAFLQIFGTVFILTYIIWSLIEKK